MKKKVGQAVALYYRVSTADQSTGMQKTDLRRYAKARGFVVYKEYCDEGVSGAKVKRPGLDRLMEDARSAYSTWCWCGDLIGSLALSYIW